MLVKDKLKQLLPLCLIAALLSGCGQDSPTRYTAQFLDLFDTVTSLVGYAQSEEEFTEISQAFYQRYYTVDGTTYHHIIDPDTLMPMDRYLSVTVLCPDSGLADALSTALFNMESDEGRTLVDSLPGTEAMWVASDGAKSYSSGFEDFVVD